MHRLRLAGRCISLFQPHNLVCGIGFRHLLLYSTSILSSTTDPVANYLVDSLGFSHQQALSTSSKFYKVRKLNDLKFDSNANSVVQFFRNFGFDDTHLRKILSSCPQLLHYNVEKNLRPKLQLLDDLGFSESDIIRVISVNPRLLLFRTESSIVPAVKIIRQVLVCDSHVIAVMEKFRWVSFRGIIENLLPNVELLSGYGIPIRLIRKRLVQRPLLFWQKPVRFKNAAIRVEKNLGIRRDSAMFLCGMYLLSAYKVENTESKYRVFKSFGWTQSDVNTFIMKNVFCFTLSDAAIKKKLDFLMNELGLKPTFLVTKSAFFTCSLEKRIMPRHKVLLTLKEKGLLEKNPSLSTAITMSESRFLNMFVLPFKEVHEVYAKLTGSSMKMLIQESSHLPSTSP